MPRGALTENTRASTTSRIPVNSASAIRDPMDIPSNIWWNTNATISGFSSASVVSPTARPTKTLCSVTPNSMQMAEMTRRIEFMSRGGRTTRCWWPCASASPSFAVADCLWECAWEVGEASVIARADGQSPRFSFPAAAVSSTTTLDGVTTVLHSAASRSIAYAGRPNSNSANPPSRCCCSSSCCSLLFSTAATPTSSAAAASEADCAFSQRSATSPS
ncbi:hypothetical protein ABL78_8488 [Leptomonas seymouri]|uniref:Uncharacterized protein n=1 Tax=Leptomonas seymouri TaxID=5684 RepID=A0A0N1HZ39_LEPSE|nr:hypothetical protein ABL78_8488 [Leptomonas seymouri]|eukprot:KPI82502.1 hypothetical protein ABL78_8488 [Leptomonas seymouri]